MDRRSLTRRTLLITSLPMSSKTRTFHIGLPSASRIGATGAWSPFACASSVSLDSTVSLRFRIFLREAGKSEGASCGMKLQTYLFAYPAMNCPWTPSSVCASRRRWWVVTNGFGRAHSLRWLPERYSTTNDRKGVTVPSNGRFAECVRRLWKKVWPRYHHSASAASPNHSQHVELVAGQSGCSSALSHIMLLKRG